MTKVWITRTQPAAAKTAESVREKGFDPIIAPLLRVAPPQTMPPIPQDEAVLIFTSSNGVRAFCNLTDRRVWRVVTVGDTTAELAKAFGFTDVQSASGTSEAVTKLIKEKYGTDTSIIHCAGDVVRGTIIEDLKAFGYLAQRHVFYLSEATDHVPSLRDMRYVLLHSPRAAERLTAMRPDCTHMTAICMSEAVRSALGILPLREIRVANAPTETALLACLP